MKELLSRFLLLMLVVGTIACGDEPDRPGVILPPPPDVIVPTPPAASFKFPEVIDCGYQSSASEVEGWTLIFEDNFDTNLSKWKPWKSGAFNNELQYYRPENVALDSNYLYIYGQRVRVTGQNNPFDTGTRTFEFASGRIESEREFGPGLTAGKDRIRFSARLRLVEGEGLWPAWWSYNDPWPTKGEIDILEARGSTPFEFQSNFHYGVNVNQVQTNAEFNDFKYVHDEKLTECFHVYELIWGRESFEILFDGKVVHTYDRAVYPYVTSFADKRHRLVLNLAIGGWFFTNLNHRNIPDESYLVIDWVRVYEQ